MGWDIRFLTSAMSSLDVDLATLALSYFVGTVLADQKVGALRAPVG